MGGIGTWIGHLGVNAKMLNKRHGIHRPWVGLGPEIKHLDVMPNVGIKHLAPQAHGGIAT